MSKRAIIYIVAGIICATGAVVLAQQYLKHDPNPAPEGPDLVSVAVADGDIEYGAPVVMEDKQDHEMNVEWVKWPADHVVEGAFTREEKLEGAEAHATRNLIDGQLILSEHVKHHDEFLPENAYVEHFWVGEDKAKKFRPGQRVDIIRKFESGETKDLIRYAQIISINEAPDKWGETSTTGSGTVGGKTSLYLILTEDMREDLDRIRKENELVVQSSRYSDPHGTPELAWTGPSPRGKAARRELELIKLLTSEKQYEAALHILGSMEEEYPDLEVTQKALNKREDIQSGRARERYKWAQRVLEIGAYERVIALCEQILDDDMVSQSVKADARELIDKAKSGREKQTRTEEYRKLCAKIQDALEGGNLPQVEKTLETLEEQFSDYQSDPGFSSPEELSETIGAELSKLQKDFKFDMRILKYYFQQQNAEEARSKLREMEKRYSEHPGVVKMKKQMRQKGLLD